MQQSPFLVERWAKVANLIEKWPEVRLITIVATDTDNTVRLGSAMSLMLKAVKKSTL